MEPWVAGNVVASLAVNQSDPAYVASRLAIPNDVVHAVLHVAGEALLLLG